MGKLFGLIFGIAFVIVLILIGPLATIWAVNTLFPLLVIPYTIETWFAIVILGAFIRAKVSINKG